MIAWTATAFACPEPGPADAPFHVWPGGRGVQVIVEVWPVGAPEGWTSSVLDVLDRHGVAAVVVVPAGADPTSLGDLARIGASAHSLGVVLPDALVPNQPSDRGPLRKAVRGIERAAGERSRTVVSRVGSKAIESALGAAGFRALVDVGGDPAGEARPAAHSDGQPPTGVVFPPGPWTAPHDLTCAPFSPPAADHLARTLERAVGRSSFPVVRWPLRGRSGSPDDAAVVDRWLTEVGIPSGATFGDAMAARAAWELRDSRVALTSAPAGRGVPVASLREAAEALRGVTVLPTKLPGDLSPSEALVGFVAVVTGHDDGVVHVPAVAPPVQGAGSAAAEPTPVDRDALIAWSRELWSALPEHLPSAARIGDRAVPARELLLALASLVRGDDPPMTHPVADPDPNAPGLGW